MWRADEKNAKRRRVTVTAEELSSYGGEISRQEAVAVTLETSGNDPRSDRVNALNLAWGGTLMTVDCLSLPSEAQRLLRGVLESPPVKVFCNAKTDLQFLIPYGINPTKIFDVTLAHQLLSENEYPSAGLEEIARRWLKEETAAEADVLLRLRRAMIGELKEKGLVWIAKIEFDCAAALAQMEYHGIQLDLAAWRELTARAEEEKGGALEELRRFGGPRPIQTTLWGDTDASVENFDSNLQILSLLREHGIEVKSTSKAALAAHRSHPLVAALSRYRAVSKQLSTYLLPIPKMLHSKTGRLHPQYVQIAAWTGRMSCYSPNIQQIPRGKEFRGCFIAPAGRLLLIADYPQIELRVAAQITRERRMLEAYRNGTDLHGLTASLILGKPLASVSREERQYAKAVNFGLIYAMGAEGLRLSARQSYGVEMTHEEAERFRRLFFEAYPSIREWHASLSRRRCPEGRTLTGRRYSFPQWYGLPAHSNAPVQGTAADILKLALGRLAAELAGSEAFIVATIHDEVIVECPRESTANCGGLLKRAMEEAARAILPDVPTTVDVRAARRWSEK
ncbi:DNA polymerase [Cloacibacillus porcorum]|uniref:DNA polymerase n=1 Tax=Cloacibacillus porcorum TaxID=1197717 RepID=UPI003D055B8D